MHPAIRSQVEIGLEPERNSEEAMIYFDPKEDMTRQEDADAADINKLLGRFGIGTPQRQVVYGEADFTMDLQQAMGSIEAAKRMHAQLPGSLKQKYPTWQSVLNAIANNQLVLDLQTPEEQESDTKKKAPLEDQGGREEPDRAKAGSRRGGKSPGSKSESDDSDA